MSEAPDWGCWSVRGFVPLVGGEYMVKAAYFSSLSQDLPNGNVITHFMKVHILLTVPYLKILRRGYHLWRVCLGWKSPLPSVPASSLLSYLPKPSLGFNLCSSAPLTGATEPFHMCKLCSSLTAHPISLGRHISHALGIFLWSREEILKGSQLAPFRVMLGSGYLFHNCSRQLNTAEAGIGCKNLKARLMSTYQGTFQTSKWLCCKEWMSRTGPNASWWNKES